MNPSKPKLKFASITFESYPDCKICSFHTNLDENHNISLERIKKLYQFACDCVELEEDNRYGELYVDLTEYSCYDWRGYPIVDLEPSGTVRKIDKYNFKPNLYE